MWGKFEKFALRPLFSSVVAGARAAPINNSENATADCRVFFHL
jgi:hypothetical protein